MILHIPLEKRYVLFKKIFSLLKPGAKMYIEDYFAGAPLTDAEKESLSKDVYIPGGELPTKEQYVTTL